MAHIEDKKLVHDLNSALEMYPPTTPEEWAEKTRGVVQLTVMKRILANRPGSIFAYWRCSEDRKDSYFAYYPDWTRKTYTLVECLSKTEHHLMCVIDTIIPGIDQDEGA